MQNPAVKLKEKERKRLYYQKNKAHIDARNNRWAAAHPDSVARSQRKWRAANPTKGKYRAITAKCAADWYRRHRAERILQIKAWRLRHPKLASHYNRQHLARKRAGGNHTYAEWLALLELVGNHCLSCGKSGSEVELTEDHIIPLSRGGNNDIDNIQPLCRSCNSIKHMKASSPASRLMNREPFQVPIILSLAS
jgi:5-methylcytosine-specific restriction endonuclease McrA